MEGSPPHSLRVAVLCEATSPQGCQREEHGAPSLTRSYQVPKDLNPENIFAAPFFWTKSDLNFTDAKTIYSFSLSHLQRLFLRLAPTALPGFLDHGTHSSVSDVTRHTATSPLKPREGPTQILQHVGLDSLRAETSSLFQTRRAL